MSFQVSWKAVASEGFHGVEDGVRSIDYWELVPGDRRSELFPFDLGSVGHAGELDTSIMLEAFPGLVPLDFTDTAATERLVGETRPDWVLCPAALSHVDYCEDHPAEAFAANLHGPLAAAKAAALGGAGFVYYSSDYVFDGMDGPYAAMTGVPRTTRLAQHNILVRRVADLSDRRIAFFVDAADFARGQADCRVTFVT